MGRQWRGLALAAVALMVLACGSGEDEPATAPGEQTEGSEEPDDSASEEAEETDPSEADEGDAGQSFSLRYASYLPEGVTAVDEALEWIAQVEERVADETPHEVEFELFLAGALADGAESLAAIRDGRTDVALIAPGNNPSDLPLSQLGGLPFMSESPTAAAATWAQLSFDYPPFREEWAAQNAVPVMWSVAGNATTGLAEPIESIADLDGLRLRAIGLHAAALNQIGVDATAMDAAEVYEAIERRVVDGYATGAFVSAVLGLSWAEPGPHTVDLGMGQFTSAAGAVFNLEVWEGLPDSVQVIMLEVAGEVLSDFAPQNLEPLDAEACERIAELGGTAFRLPDSEISALRDEVFDEVFESWVSNVQDAGLDEAVALELADEFSQTEAQFADETAYVDGLIACTQQLDGDE
jgi:TRAP-type C4-dicarboxylate transport system substrate-binding protein